LASINLATGAVTTSAAIGETNNANVNSLAAVLTTTFTPPTPPAGATAGQRFVAQVFLDLLGRAPGQSDLAALGAFIDQGLLGRLPFVLAVEQSPEHLARVVNQDYFTTLGRPADASALNAGVLFLASGGSNAGLLALLYSSSEYSRAVGGTNNAFLGTLFRAVTGQTIDANSLSVFNSVLNAGLSATSLAQLLLQTPAAAQQQVTRFFQTFLGRTPSAAELAAHAALVAAGQADLDLAIILASQEFSNVLAA
jgi:hypothetical protein